MDKSDVSIEIIKKSLSDIEFDFFDLTDED